MKKFLSLIAALMIYGGTSVSAQGTYAIQEKDVITKGLQITSVDNVVLTFAEAGAAGKKTVNWAIPEFVAYSAGAVNGSYANGKAPSGGYYQFDVKKKGSLTVAVQLAASKAFYILDKDFKQVAFTYNMPAADKGESQEMTTSVNSKKGNVTEYKVAVKTNGSATFDVEANGTYYVFADGTKMGIFGFKYSVAEASSSETVKITSAGFATHAASFAVNYSKVDGLKAYSVSYDQATDKLSYTEINGVVAAKTPVLLAGAAKDYTLEATSDAATVTETGLKVSDGTVKGGNNIYCLANQKEGVGFYQVSSSVTIPANKAYIELTRSASSRPFYSIGGNGGTTGLNQIEAVEASDNAAIYTLSGQRVSKSYKGIVIKNGKKMIQK